MKIGYGNGTTEYGPGVLIRLNGDEVALAISAWLHAKGVYIDGARTIRVNGDLCASGEVYVDPSGKAVRNGKAYYGRGPE